MTENIDTNLKAPKFKVNDRDRITKYNNIFSKGYTENCSIEIFIIDSVFKTNPWTYKMKDLNRKNNMKFFWKKIVAEEIINQIVILKIKSK